MASNKEEGNRGEQIAKEYLKRLGFEILEMNFRFGHGEIDIIAKDCDTLVFCEVKMRKSDEYGDPEYAITSNKQKQIRKIAQGYLYEHEIKDQDCRFDVVAVRIQQGTPEVNYIRNAF
jgi:putative endonuclease